MKRVCTGDLKLIFAIGLAIAAFKFDSGDPRFKGLVIDLGMGSAGALIGILVWNARSRVLQNTGYYRSIFS